MAKIPFFYSSMSKYLLLCLAFVHGQCEGFRVAFGSCNDVNKSQILFDKILDREPEAWIWGGDNVYADFRPYFLDALVNDFEFVKSQFPKPPFYPALPNKHKYLYDKLESDPHYKRFVEKIGQDNIVGTWDDHDFGQNDNGKNYPFKKESQEAFMDFFHVPKDDKMRHQEGVYSFKDFDQGKLRVILLDNRYHRDEYANKSGDFLGDVQWSWLHDTLATSSARVNLIVSGLQVLPDSYLRSRTEAWSKLPLARLRLLNMIAESDASGILLISGDVHFSELMSATCRCDSNVSFELPEVTSSGMTHSWATYPQILHWGMETFMRLTAVPYQIRHQFYLRMNFGEIVIRDNSLDVKIMSSEGTEVLSNSFFLSNMKQVGRSTGCLCEPTHRRKDLWQVIILAGLWICCCFLPIIATCTFMLSLPAMSSHSPKTKKE